MNEINSALHSIFNRYFRVLLLFTFLIVSRGLLRRVAAATGHVCFNCASTVCTPLMFSTELPNTE